MCSPLARCSWVHPFELCWCDMLQEGALKSLADFEFPTRAHTLDVQVATAPAASHIC